MIDLWRKNEKYHWISSFLGSTTLLFLVIFPSNGTLDTWYCLLIQIFHSWRLYSWLNDIYPAIKIYFLIWNIYFHTLGMEQCKWMNTVIRTWRLLSFCFILLPFNIETNQFECTFWSLHSFIFQSFFFCW